MFVLCCFVLFCVVLCCCLLSFGSWVDFWSFWGCLGSIFGRFGGSEGGLGGTFGGLGRLLAGSWGVLGASWGILRPSWSSWVVLGHFQDSKAPRAAAFGRPRGAKMKSKSDPRRTKIEDKNEDEKRSSWRSSWSRLGAILARFGVVLGAPGGPNSYCGCSGARFVENRCC